MTISSASWYVANEILVKPRDLIIEQQGIKIDDLKEKMQDQELNIEKLERKIDPNNRSRLLPNFSIKITNPKNGDHVSVSTIVRGTLLGELPKGLYMWVLINPRTFPGQWWPQPKRIEPMNEHWSVQAWVSDTSFFHINKEFEIGPVQTFVSPNSNRYQESFIHINLDSEDFIREFHS